MEYKVPEGVNTNEILIKLAGLQKELNSIKDSLEIQGDINLEMKEWEETSSEDTNNFLEKHNL